MPVPTRSGFCQCPNPVLLKTANGPDSPRTPENHGVMGGMHGAPHKHHAPKTVKKDSSSHEDTASHGQSRKKHGSVARELQYDNSSPKKMNSAFGRSSYSGMNQLFPEDDGF
jgi:hypothetical protein